MGPGSRLTESRPPHEKDLVELIFAGDSTKLVGGEERYQHDEYDESNDEYSLHGSAPDVRNALCYCLARPQSEDDFLN